MKIKRIAMLVIFCMLLTFPGVSVAKEGSYGYDMYDDYFDEQEWYDHNYADYQSGADTETGENPNPKVVINIADLKVKKSVYKFANDVVDIVALQLMHDTIGDLRGDVQIVLAGTHETYTSALLNLGAPVDKIVQIAREASAVTIGSNIVIALHKTEHLPELADTITHELTHVVLNQNGMSDQMPLWVIEGLAWYEGMLVQTDLDPVKTKKLVGSLNYELNQVIKDGQLIPLDKLRTDYRYYSAPYNVEWQSYLAMLYLITAPDDGWETLSSFTKDIPEIGFEPSFKKHYNKTLREYEDEFYLRKVGYKPAKFN